jgi:hypothetical protein
MINQPWPLRVAAQAEKMQRKAKNLASTGHFWSAFGLILWSIIISYSMYILANLLTKKQK